MYNILKRTIDIISSIIFIVILFPLLLIISINILIVSGRPIIFTQKRIKNDGKVFKMYKFRTMHNQSKEPIANQESITKEGRNLRKFHLDELPQILNILKGDMSLIGPRPLISKEYFHHIKLDPDYKKIYSNKPGIICLDGILGYMDDKNRTKIMRKLNLNLTSDKQLHNKLSDKYHQKKKERELFYLENKSFILDIKMIFWTFIMLTHKTKKRKG